MARGGGGGATVRSFSIGPIGPTPEPRLSGMPASGGSSFSKLSSSLESASGPRALPRGVQLVPEPVVSAPMDLLADPPAQGSPSAGSPPEQLAPPRTRGELPGLDPLPKPVPYAPHAPPLHEPPSHVGAAPPSQYSATIRITRAHSVGSSWSSSTGRSLCVVGRRSLKGEGEMGVRGVATRRGESTSTARRPNRTIWGFSAALRGSCDEPPQASSRPVCLMGSPIGFSGGESRGLCCCPGSGLRAGLVEVGDSVAKRGESRSSSRSVDKGAGRRMRAPGRAPGRVRGEGSGERVCGRSDRTGATKLSAQHGGNTHAEMRGEQAL